MKQVDEERRKTGHHLNKQVTLAVDESFMDELLKYDFTSSKKGRRLGNLLVVKKKTGAKNLHPQPMQCEEPMDQEEERDVIHAPLGGNIKLWHD